MLTLHASDDEVAGGDDVTALQGLDPPQSSAFWVVRKKRLDSRVVTHLEPPGGFNHYRFLFEFHIILGRGYGYRLLENSFEYRVAEIFQE